MRNVFRVTLFEVWRSSKHPTVLLLNNRIRRTSRRAGSSAGFAGALVEKKEKKSEITINFEGVPPCNDIAGATAYLGPDMDKTSIFFFSETIRTYSPKAAGVCRTASERQTENPQCCWLPDRDKNYCSATTGCTTTTTTVVVPGCYIYKNYDEFLRVSEDLHIKGIQPLTLLIFRCINNSC